MQREVEFLICSACVSVSISDFVSLSRKLNLPDRQAAEE
jgi:hypothetical protein